MNHQLVFLNTELVKAKLRENLISAQVLRPKRDGPVKIVAMFNNPAGFPKQHVVDFKDNGNLDDLDPAAYAINDIVTNVVKALNWFSEIGAI